MTFPKFSCCIALIYVRFLQSSHIDLENFSQDFVRETKQIILEEYPTAFNPSIIRWQHNILMSFRVIPDPKNSFVSYIGLVWLNEDLKPISKPMLLDFRPNSTIPSRAEDGRLVSIKDKLYLIYSDNVDPVISKKGFRMHVARLSCKGRAPQKVLIEQIERLSLFEGCDNNQREKNWVPFVSQDTLLLGYSITPHKIFKPDLTGTEFCQSIGTTEARIDWQWGEPRGGTTALRYRDHYLSFFHSSLMMKSVHHPKLARHYFIGAYTFSTQFPFNITGMSSFPIIGKNFYHGTTYKPYWGSIVAVFPCGFIDADDSIVLAYGRQDHEMWIAKIDKQGLYKSLIPIKE